MRVYVSLIFRLLACLCVCMVIHETNTPKKTHTHTHTETLIQLPRKLTCTCGPSCSLSFSLPRSLFLSLSLSRAFVLVRVFSPAHTHNLTPSLRVSTTEYAPCVVRNTYSLSPTHTKHILTQSLSVSKPEHFSLSHFVSPSLTHKTHPNTVLAHLYTRIGALLSAKELLILPRARARSLSRTHTKNTP